MRLEGTWNGCTSQEAVYTKEDACLPAQIASSHIGEAGKATVTDMWTFSFCGLFTLYA